MIALTWMPRDNPLEPLGICASGPAAVRLRGRLLELDDDVFHQLRGASGSDMLAIEGPREALVWVEGVAYFGRDSRAPTLLLPTTLRPQLAIAVVEMAATRGLSAPVLLMPGVWASFAAARRLARESLEAWSPGS